MLQRDYLMKMLQDLFSSIAKIISNDQQNLTEKQKDIAALYTIFGHDAQFFRNTDINSIMLKMSKLEDFLTRLEMLAEVYYTDAKFYTGSYEVISELRKKSLYLLEYVDERSDEFSIHRGERIEELKKMIE